MDPSDSSASQQQQQVRESAPRQAQTSPPIATSLPITKFKEVPSSLITSPPTSPPEGQVSATSSSFISSGTTESPTITKNEQSLQELRSIPITGLWQSSFTQIEVLQDIDQHPNNAPAARTTAKSKWKCPSFNGSELRQAYASFIANLGMLGLGTVIGWTSTGIPSLKATNFHQLTTMQKSWIGSISHLGGLTSCIIGAFTIDKLGRKNSMLIFTIPFIIGWLITIFGESHIGLIYAGRYFVGLAGAFYGISGPVFVSEIADEKIRGFLSNFYGLFLCLGILISFSFGYFLTWKELSILCLFIPVICFIALFTVPESPRFYIQIGKEDAAIKSLFWYRKTATMEEIEIEIKQFKKTIEEINKSRGQQLQQNSTSGNGIQELFKRGAIEPLLISIALVFFEQFSGYPAVIAYTGQIFKESKLQMDSNIAAIIIGIAQLVSTCISALIVDKVGRILLLVSSQVVNFIVLAGMGTYFYFEKQQSADNISDSFGWIPVTCLSLYIISLSVGIGPISTMLMSELLPQNIRGIGSAVCTGVLRIIAFLVSFGFDGIADLLGIEYCFWIFAGICISGAIFSYFVVPETKGKSLEAIREYFMKSGKK